MNKLSGQALGSFLLGLLSLYFVAQVSRLRVQPLIDLLILHLDRLLLVVTWIDIANLRIRLYHITYLIHLPHLLPTSNILLLIHHRLALHTYRLRRLPHLLLHVARSREVLGRVELSWPLVCVGVVSQHLPEGRISFLGLVQWKIDLIYLNAAYRME